MDHYLKTMALRALLLLTTAGICASQSGQQPGPSSGPSPALWENPPSLNTFYLNLYKELVRASPSDNLVFSPTSIAIALGMTLMGSRGRTYDQLAQALGFQGQNITQISDTFAQMVRMNQLAVPGNEVSTSNLLYSSHLLGMEQEYSDNILRIFEGHPEVVDFSESEAVRAKINSAVARETKDKIKDLIPSGLLDAFTRLVLVNAIYFKGLWQIPFSEEGTRNKTFWDSENRTVPVPMMSVDDQFLFYEDEDFSLATMDYKGGILSMVLVVPHERMGLAKVEAKLTSEDLVRIPLKEAKPRWITIDLPRFKLDISKYLVDTLEKLGVTDLVTKGKCDLSGIGGDPGFLYLSKLIHKAFIEVNEQGTEAAAATVSVIAALSISPGIHADHPFMFYILDRRSADILFMGRVTKFS